MKKIVFKTHYSKNVGSALIMTNSHCIVSVWFEQMPVCVLTMFNKEYDLLISNAKLYKKMVVYLLSLFELEELEQTSPESKKELMDFFDCAICEIHQLTPIIETYDLVAVEKEFDYELGALLFKDFVKNKNGNGKLGFVNVWRLGKPIAENTKIVCNIYHETINKLIIGFTFNEQPVCIFVLDSSSNKPNVANRFITNQNFFRKMVNYIQTLFEIEEINSTLFVNAEDNTSASLYYYHLSNGHIMVSKNGHI
jgi:hypothetical protein